ncbi:hypothetical protein BGW80DRAFT_1354056 [Lactifluus volemus]|nr:hypothetical protein BGW80DRAFT_1354056 [Lactifluus volemus]
MLAGLLRLRWDRSKQPDDIKYCVKYFRYLRDQPLQAIHRDRVTSSLVLALAEQVESMSDNYLTNAFTADHDIPGELRDEVIECVREANTRLPGSPELSCMLGYCLAKRFFKAFTTVDYEEAMVSLNKAITSASDFPEDTGSDLQQRSLRAIANLSYRRYVAFKTPEHLEVAISHIRTFLSSAPLDHPDRVENFRRLTELSDERVEEH